MNVRRIGCEICTPAGGYGLDGTLLRAPHTDGNPGFALHPVGAATWGGFLFVSVGRDGPGLAEWLGELPAKLAM